MSKCKRGDWIGIFNPVLLGHVPLSRPCQVVAVGKRIKATRLDRYGDLDSQYFLLREPEVLHVFASKEEGMERCKAAYDAAMRHRDEVAKLAATHKANVLSILREGTA